MENKVLEIEHLRMELPVNGNFYPVIDDVSLEVRAGEIVALVGESGCGKTMTALSAIGLQPPKSRITEGSIHAQNRELELLSKKEWEGIRGKHTTMIFQEPMTALNPLMTVGKNAGHHAAGGIAGCNSFISLLSASAVRWYAAKSDDCTCAVKQSAAFDCR